MKYRFRPICHNRRNSSKKTCVSHRTRISLSTHLATSLSVSLKFLPLGTHLILKQVEAFVHISLDLYAFIAITASAPTLDGLIDMVQADNDRRQEELDEVGEAPERALNVNTRLIDIVL